MRHRFHALCPYFAMFPETFSERWIDQLTEPGDVVLDPFCGRGTVPFQALLMARQSIGVDVNDVAYCVTSAKTDPPKILSVKRRITALERDFRWRSWEQARRLSPDFFHYAYRPMTLRQLLYLRDVLAWRTSKTDCMIAALVLGALHGESHKSSSYLSNQMPRTISTKPRYSIRFWEERGLVAPDRDVFQLLTARSEFRYESDPVDGIATIFHSDMRDLPRLIRDKGFQIRCAITSPPYLNVTSFEEDQWLRLWFLGGPPHPTRNRVSRDDRHERPDAYWKMIADMWRALGYCLSERAHVVLRIGATQLSPDQIVTSLVASSVFAGRKVELKSSATSKIKGRQTDVFRPGSRGCTVEVDCHFQFV